MKSQESTAVNKIAKKVMVDYSFLCADLSAVLKREQREEREDNLSRWRLKHSKELLENIKSNLSPAIIRQIQSDFSYQINDADL